MKFSSFEVTQEEFDLPIDDATYHLKALNADQYTTVEMFLTGSAESILNLSQKYGFVRKNILGWSGVQGDDGSEMECKEETKSLLLNPKLDDLLNLMILECYRKRKATIDKIEEDKEAAGK